jgi:hypothetical protein
MTLPRRKVKRSSSLHRLLFLRLHLVIPLLFLLFLLLLTRSIRSCRTCQSQYSPKGFGSAEYVHFRWKREVRLRLEAFELGEV